ncbi:MAG: hypothetical protein IT368_06285 [Candidatus Hydrogenedentes bacterium]|nr:hypothetical protein [Candidatus Hydrogenedentota bacterium]
MNLNKYLDAAKEKTGSDYATAKALGVTPQTISMARKHGSISNELARKIAELIGCSPLDVIAAGEVAKHPERRKNWEKWVTAASIMLAIGATNNLQIQEVAASEKGNTLYIMRSSTLVDCRIQIATAPSVYDPADAVSCRSADGIKSPYSQHNRHTL